VTKGIKRKGGQQSEGKRSLNRLHPTVTLSHRNKKRLKFTVSTTIRERKKKVADRRVYLVHVGLDPRA